MKGLPGPRDDAHGVTARERAILGRVEAGMTARAVAAELGVEASYVAHVVRMYPVSEGGHRAWRRAAELSNTAFLLAVAATGRTFA